MYEPKMELTPEQKAILEGKEGQTKAKNHKQGDHVRNGDVTKNRQELR